MFKYILLAAVVWAMPSAMAHAGESATTQQLQPQATPQQPGNDFMKESIDATRAPSLEMTPYGVPAPSDLTLDPPFGNGGMVTTGPPGGTGLTNENVGLRVYPYTVCGAPPGSMGMASPQQSYCYHTGYYVFGRQKETGGTWRPWVTRIMMNGLQDHTFGSGGFIFPYTPHDPEVVDAAMTSSRVYTLSTMDFGGTRLMRVTCTLLANGTGCSGFEAVIDFGVNPLGAVTQAYAQRIVYDHRYGLFIAGKIHTNARGWEIAIARLDADTGALITEFHGNGMNTGLPGWAAQTNSEIDVYDMTVVPAGTPGGERLYVAGKIKFSGGDFDGFLVGLDPNNGYTSTGWSWKAIRYELDNLGSGNKEDAVTAITVQRNGRLALAGWSGTPTAGEHSMILGRFKADGTSDYSFCQGQAICKRNFPWSGVVDNDWPAAIAERDGNRDLVVAVMSRRPAASDPHLRQNVVEYSSNGNLKYAHRVLDYPSRGATLGSRPYGMWIGHTGMNGSGGEVIAVVGMRHWAASNDDATISHLIANDSIFADQFGGQHND